MSKALALRNAALRLAARDKSDLDLTAPNELMHLLSPIMHEAVDEAQTIVVMGASTPGLAADLVSRVGSRRLTIFERDIALVPVELQAPSDPSGSNVRMSAEPIDLRIDPQASDSLVAAMKPTDYASYKAVADRIAERAAISPLVPDSSVDLVISDCMTNRLAEIDAARMLNEAFRVLRRGGRMLEVCLLADEPVPAADAAMEMGSWHSARLPLEAEGAKELASAGFHGITYHALLPRPVRTVKGVELRVFLMEASKGKQGDCRDQGHAIVYRGPWSEVHDDDGHRYVRGERTAVCAKTYELLMRAPYCDQFIGLPAYADMPLHRAPHFDCNVASVRSPAVTKGKVSVLDGRIGNAPSGCCSPTQAGEK